MIDVKKVRELSKELTVLYAEDEIDIQRELKNTFSLFFKKVIVANDGEEGLRLYREHKNEIDLVITDIRMPNMDGLEMVEEIRKRDRDLHIVLLTAFSDQEYFVKSINLKIDKYLLKPIDQMNFIHTVHDIANAISQRKLLAQFMKENQEAEIRSADKKTMLNITEAYSFPMVIFQGQKMVHYSGAFGKLFSNEKQLFLKEFTLQTEGLFEIEDKFLRSLAGYDDRNLEYNKVKIIAASGVKVFRVYKKDIEFSGENSQMYILIDITYEEYLRVKAESYTHSLENMVVKQKTVREDVKPQERVVQKEVITNVIDDSSNNSNEDKISAKEFLSTVNPAHITEIEELYQTDREFHEAILLFEDGDDDKLKDIGGLIEHFANKIYIYDDFTDLHIVLKNLSEILLDADFAEIPISEHSNFIMQLHRIRESLSKWRTTIFIDESASDIHYLDQIIFSASLQIETILNNARDDVFDDFDEMEFF